MKHSIFLLFFISILTVTYGKGYNSNNLTGIDSSFVNALDYGVSTSNSDNSAPMQNAINFAIANNKAGVFIPYGSYKFQHSITTNRNCQLKSNVGTLDFSSCSDSVAIIIKDTLIYPTNYSTGNIVLKALNIIGSDSTAQCNSYANISNVKYKRGLYAVQFKAPGLILQECIFSGFDKVTNFGSNSYIIYFENCGFYANNYGVYYNPANNSGERISFEDCSIGNNINGIYCQFGYLHFNNCSIDYNATQIINHQDNGGFNLGVIRIQNSHLECDKNPNYQYLNYGDMVIENSNIVTFDQSGTAPSWFNNQYRLALSNDFIGINSEKYLVDGIAPEYSGKMFTISGLVQMIHPDLNPINGDMENGIQGWTVNPATNTIQQDQSLSHNGNASLRINSWEYGSGVANMNNILVNGGAEMQIQWYSNFLHDTTGTEYLNLQFYDRNGALIDTAVVGTLSGVGGVNQWLLGKINWTKIPKNALYANFYIQSRGIGGTYYNNIDDVYITYRGGSSNGSYGGYTK